MTEKNENVNSDEALNDFNAEIKKSIDFIIEKEDELEAKMELLKSLKEQLKEDYKAVSAKLSIKPAQLKERINLILSSVDEPEILPAKKNTITFVELYNEAGGRPEKKSINTEAESE